MVIYGNFSMSVGQCRQGKVKCKTSPTLVSVSAVPMRGRRAIFVGLPAESNAANVYIGNENVKPQTGMPISAGCGIILPINSQGGAGRFWMIADTECDVQVVEFSE